MRPSPSTRTARATSTTTPQPRAPRTNCLEKPAKDYSDPRLAIGLHPVSRLHEIQAKNYESLPVFKEIGHRRHPTKNNVEFHIQVKINDKTASAWAHTKKDAKRRAAIQMLTQMGLQVEIDSSNNLNSK